jgi:hypothetical protein
MFPLGPSQRIALVTAGMAKATYQKLGGLLCQKVRTIEHL